MGLGEIVIGCGFLDVFDEETFADHLGFKRDRGDHINVDCSRLREPGQLLDLFFHL